MATKIEELEGTLQLKGQEWMTIYQAKPDLNFTVEEVDQMKTINDEMDALGKEQDSLIDTQKSAVEIERQMKAAEAPRNGVGFGYGGSNAETLTKQRATRTKN